MNSNIHRTTPEPESNEKRTGSEASPGVSSQTDLPGQAGDPYRRDSWSSLSWLRELSPPSDVAPAGSWFSWSITSRPPSSAIWWMRSSTCSWGVVSVMAELMESSITWCSYEPSSDWHEGGGETVKISPFFLVPPPPSSASFSSSPDGFWLLATCAKRKACPPAGVLPCVVTVHLLKVSHLSKPEDPAGTRTRTRTCSISAGPALCCRTLWTSSSRSGPGLVPDERLLSSPPRLCSAAGRELRTSEKTSFSLSVLVTRLQQWSPTTETQVEVERMLRLAEQCLDRAKSFIGKRSVHPAPPVLHNASCSSADQSEAEAGPKAGDRASAAEGQVDALSQFGLSDDGGQPSSFPPPDVFQRQQTAASHDSSRKTLTPVEEASRQNQKLQASYEARVARLAPGQASQKTSL
ncbi:hypothetical protein CCH79_00020167, partial [Gambusia affinis]